MSMNDDDADIIAAARAGFLDEATDMLQQFEQALLIMETSPDDAENLNAAFRAAHTIKGTSGLFGYDDVAGHTHIETTVSTSARQIETGVSGLTVGEAADLTAIAAKVALLQIAAGNVLADIKAVNGYSVAGAGTPGNPWGPV
jgi:two-component system chemotaxis sensor kinase CheA